jgi:hypothetical protein
MQKGTKGACNERQSKNNKNKQNNRFLVIAQTTTADPGKSCFTRFLK